MFQLTGRVLDNDLSVWMNDELRTVKQFIFLPELQRMSVIVRNKDNSHEFFLKGSPEKVATLCDNVPADLKEQISVLTQQGLRVLALAGKKVNLSKDENMNTIRREDLEKNLEYLGLLVLGAKLKRATIPTLKILKNADIRCIMATGDNLETAISIGKKCGLLEKEPKKIHTASDICLDKDQDFDYAMSADTFNQLLLENKDLLKQAIHKLQVVARMKPDEKEALVHLL